MARVEGWLSCLGLKGDDDEEDDKEEALLDSSSQRHGPFYVEASVAVR